LLLFLFSLGHALEERSLDHARKSIRALGELAPKTALLQSGSGDIEVPVDRLEVGDRILIRPGVRLPADGVVVAGESTVNQAPVTGESTPVAKRAGDKVYAGSINGEGVLELKVTRPARDSTLAKVVKMIEQAQGQKFPTQRIVDRFTRIFVPAILIGVVVMITVPLLFGVPFRESFLRAMILLVATSPCALVLGPPAAVLAGIARAARSGVLIKGGIHLESLGNLRAIAFDKTGTLTYGHPSVTDIEPWYEFNRTSGELCDTDYKAQRTKILRLAAGVESYSAHPIARAITASARETEIEIPTAQQAESLTGFGARAIIDGLPAWVGNKRMAEMMDASVPVELQTRLDALEEMGKTVVIAGEGQSVVGLIAIADEVRRESHALIEDLKRSGIEKAIILTGDNGQVAHRIAEQIGAIDHRAGLMPEDKVEAVRRLVGEYRQVAMVGDGVNDAPAFVQANLGIAMGGASTDVALETADVVLMADDLSRLPFAIELGRATRKIIRQNLAISIGVIAGLIALSLSGYTSLGLAIGLHEASTVLVVLNAMRLLRFNS
jgi:Zn2+/Cd2+-exporting ATPase